MQRFYVSNENEQKHTKTTKLTIYRVYGFADCLFLFDSFWFFCCIFVARKIYKHTTQNEEENINYFTPTRVAERSHTAIS